MGKPDHAGHKGQQKLEIYKRRRRKYLGDKSRKRNRRVKYG